MATKEWGYDETSNKLNSRINVHEDVGEKCIDEWILDIVKIKKGENILDLGCGTGKQVISFGKILEGTGGITACDIKNDLIDKAKSAVKENGISNVSFILHDMNKKLPFQDNSFDMISSCFAIYYVDDPEVVIKDCNRVLRKDGRMFIAGPTPQNTKDFWDLHEKITGKMIPEVALKRRARIHDVFIPLMKKHFSNVVVEVFNNSLKFRDSQQLLDWYTTSLLFKEGIEDDKKEIVVKDMKEAVEEEIQRNGFYEVKKQVYGVLGFKR